MQDSKRKKRKSYFVIEAIKIIQQQGLGNLTARSVAEAAGFNPASIYNYFDNMDHLENTASIYFTKEYTSQLMHYTKGVKTGIESYLIMWELFLYYALNSPYLFYNVFYSAISQSGNHNLFAEYYELFPEERPLGGFIEGMIGIDKTQNRGLFVLDKCVEEGSLTQEMLAYINDIHIGYTKCIFTDIVKSSLYQASPALFRRCMRYIVYSMLHFIDPCYLHIAERYLDFYQVECEDYHLLCCWDEKTQQGKVPPIGQVPTKE